MRFLVLLSLCSCAGSASPRERYVNALNQRLEGNSKAYYDELIALAHDEPDTRAGRRARATLRGSDLATTASVIGVLAAVAVPNFSKFQSRAQQSEAQAGLKSLYVAQKSYYGETQRYCTTFAQCEWRPEPGSRYVYYLGPKEVMGGDAVSDPDMLRMRAETTLSAMGVRPSVAKGKFLIVAVGDPDGDGMLDVWSIDEQNNLLNLLNDME
jgi:type IV pilus assembly protein PilA